MKVPSVLSQWPEEANRDSGVEILYGAKDSIDRWLLEVEFSIWGPIHEPQSPIEGS